MAPNLFLSLDLKRPECQIEAMRWVLSGIREKMFLSKFSVPGDFINPTLLLDVLVQAQSGLNHYKGPNAFKTAGYICFWIARLKPFRAFTPSYTNEKMALLAGLAIVAESHGAKAIPAPIWDCLLYDLRYGHTAPMTVANQLSLLYHDDANHCHCSTE